MADDIQLNQASGTAGATIAADDIGGIHHQRVKVQHGADGSATDTALSSPLPTTQGVLAGSNYVKKFGRYDSVGTSYTPVCMGGVYQMPQASGATTLRIKAGGDANDTAAGSGAREVTLEGLDENWAEVTEAIATNGASASSATTTTFTRLYRMYVSASGTYANGTTESHNGDIVIENGAGGTDWGTIDSTDFGHSQSEIGWFSVPTGKTAYVWLDDITIDTTKSTDLLFMHRANADETAAPYTAMRAKSVIVGLKNSEDLSGRNIPYGPFAGPCDIGFLAKIDAGTASVAVEFEVMME